jgi:YD repeat-containing protein
MGYDAIGRVVSFTDGANKLTQFAYDTDDNLTQVTDAINGVTRYTYTTGVFGEGKLLSAPLPTPRASPPASATTQKAGLPA